MDNWRIPLHALWTSDSNVTIQCTPNNGLLYISGNRLAIGYISEINEDNKVTPEIIFFTARFLLKSIACDLNWKTTKYFATISETNEIHLWDLDTKTIAKGHQYHSSCNKAAINKDNAPVMCFTRNRLLLSIMDNILVKYCIMSNTYDVLRLTHNNLQISMLSSSPYDPNIIAIGTKNGLVIIQNLSDQKIFYRLRGHDSQITSMDWMQFNIKQSISYNGRSIVQDDDQENINDGEPNKSEESIVESDNTFNIYNYDQLENEFGTLTDKEIVTNNSMNDNIDNDNIDYDNLITACSERSPGDYLDYLDMCQKLKKDILHITDSSTNDTDSTTSVNDSNISVDENKIVKTENPTAKTKHAQEQCGSEKNKNNEKYSKIFLTTSSLKDSFVWIWDTISGSAVLKIETSNVNATTYWIQKNTLVINKLNDIVMLYKIDCDENGKCVVNKKSQENLKFTHLCNNLFTAHSGEPTTSQIMWSISHQQIYCFKVDTLDGTIKILAEFGTLPIRMHSIQESPHDPNRLAIGGNNRQISILNVSNLTVNNVRLTTYSNKIKGKVLSISWHPVNEYILGFSTHEGRVGIYDTTKPTNNPIILKPFTGKEVYSISWMGIKHEVDNDTLSYVLFACDGKTLVYFNEKGSHKLAPITFLEESSQITSVNGNNMYLAVGTHNGLVMLYTSSLKEIWSQELSKKYISDLCWNNIDRNVLAVACMDSTIKIVQCKSPDSIAISSTLSGHSTGLTSIKWSSQTQYKLVSTSNDRTVRVWNTRTLECLSIYLYNCPMFCANFYPLNDNFIVCSGATETFHMFDSTKNMHSVSQSVKSKIKDGFKIDFAIEQKSIHTLTSNEKHSNRKRSQRKMIKNDITSNLNEITSDLNEITEQLNDTSITDGSHAMKVNTSLKFNFTTLLHLTNKEFNKSALNCLNSILNINCNPDHNTDNDETFEQKDFINKKLFSTRDEVKELLAIELKNHKNSGSDSVAKIIFPQLTYQLRDDILDKIERKILTDQHIALAPMISFDFWKHCCKSYAIQFIDKGWTFCAIPYLLACHEVNESIEYLCSKTHYREAWVIAKIHKEDDDKIFDQISLQWIKYLENIGRLEEAALISTFMNNFTLAFTILSKRTNVTEELQTILDVLKAKV